jgi:hypothetical protein
MHTIRGVDHRPERVPILNLEPLLFGHDRTVRVQGNTAPTTQVGLVDAAAGVEEATSPPTTVIHP